MNETQHEICSRLILKTSKRYQLLYFFQLWAYYSYATLNKLHRYYIQKQPPEVFCKKCVLRNFAKFTEKHLCKNLFFNKVAGLSQYTIFHHMIFFKKRHISKSIEADKFWKIYKNILSFIIKYNFKNVPEAYNFIEKETGVFLWILRNF